MDLQRTTCNRQAIERFLADQLSDEEQGAFEDHLESCLACREYLDSAAADASWWQETRGYLASDAEPPRPAEGSSEDALSPLYGLKNFLAPTDDPRMLGKLGGYDVVGVVGCGGMGVVLKAFDAPLHRYVAIKVLGPQLALSAAARQRFAREAKAGATVVHPNVMAIHAVAEANGLPYFVMPYVRGPSLEKRLQQTGTFAVVEVVRIGMQIAAGLAAAHAQGLVHRDIKPANILLEEGVERVTITDFGLARAVDDASLTKSGVIAGTPQFMSPEQASGQPVDHRSDLFSLGSVLYALCTGRPPFRADTTLAVLRRVEEGQPRPIREINPDVPAWLAGIVERLQARDPADRFQSAAEVAGLLERWLAHLHQPLLVPAPELPTPPAGASPRAKPTGQRSRLLALSGAVVLLAVLALSSPFLFQLVVLSRPEPPVALNQDFRDGRRPLPPLKLCGRGVVAASKQESGGFRITVPADRVAPATDIPGVMMDSPIKGDFEITAGYELLQADRPATGNGVGFELYLMTDTPTQEAVAFMHAMRVKEGNVYSCARMTTTDGRRQYRNHFVPTASSSGRLRLTRTGKEVVFWAADDTGSFRELLRHDLGPEDVKLVRLAANTGSAQVPLDLRIVGLTIRANSPLAEPPPTPPDASTMPVQSRWKLWLVGTLLVVLVVLLGVGLYVRRGRRAEQTPPRVLVKDRQAGPQAPVPPSAGRRALVGARRLWPLLLVFPAAVGLGIALVMTLATRAPTPQGEGAREYYQSFKDHSGDVQGLHFTGPDVESCLRFEPTGLRLTLPPGHPGQRPNTGLVTDFSVQGDFEITVAYEILREPEPADTTVQTRFTLFAPLDRPGQNRATLSRRVTKDGGTQFYPWLITRDETSGDVQRVGNEVATQAKAGRLRLARTGAELSYYVSDSLDGEFVLLERWPFGREDLKELRIVGSTGGAQATLDVRVIDLRIRADSLPNLPVAALRKPGGKGWLLGLLSLSLAGTLVLGAWLCVRQRRRAAESAPARSAAVSPGVSFTCPGCGKSLKARAEQAGKKLKCPQCAGPVVVPGMAESPRPSP